MKLLIFACFLGLAATSFLQEASPAVDEAVIAFLEGSMESGSLKQALGESDPIFDVIEDDVKTELGKTLKEALDKVLEKIKGNIENGKEVAEILKKQVKDLKEKLKDLHIDVSENAKKILEQVKDKAKQLLKELFERMGFGKRNLDDQMDEVARMKLRDFIEKIKEKLLSKETIQKIRDYIENLSSDHPVIQQLKELVEKLKNVDFREIIKRLLEHNTGVQKRDLKDTWEKIKDYLKERHIELKDKLGKFGDWLKETWNQGLEKLKDKHELIRKIAMEFISHAKDISAEIARESLEFFRPYKEDLGTLWEKIVDASKEAIGRF